MSPDPTAREGVSPATTEYYREPVTSNDPDEGRRIHYGDFYGVSDTTGDERPLLVVWGNCQAEALRIVVSSAADLPYRTVRVPPVHELTDSDLPHVRDLMARCAVLLSQPVRSGYRGLPIGTDDVDALRSTRAEKIVWPVLRYSGLYPFQVIVRHPSAPSATPAGVPYHDLRTVIAARDGDSAGWDVPLSARQVTDVAAWSIAELARRERAQCDVGVSDLLLPAGAGAANTVNHPGNSVLTALGSRILDALGCGPPAEPDRELLGNIVSPLDERVVRALDLQAPPRPSWLVDGSSVSQDEIRRVQLQWYRDNPPFVDAAIQRYADLLDILDMAA